MILSYTPGSCSLAIHIAARELSIGLQLAYFAMISSVPAVAAAVGFDSNTNGADAA